MPMLAHPTTKGKFILDTDNSHNCMRSVLSQIQDGNCMHIKKIVIQRDSTKRTRKELLAVHIFVHYFKHNLSGRQYGSAQLFATALLIFLQLFCHWHSPTHENSRILVCKGRPKIDRSILQNSLEQRWRKLLTNFNPVAHVLGSRVLSE